jgi:hypothetical protein
VKGQEMTRKDYELVAKVIATSWHASGESKREIAVNLAEAFETDNPRFDSERFLRACGVTSSLTERMFTPEGKFI